MRYKDNRRPCSSQLINSLETPRLKLRVANCQDFIEQEDVRIQMCRDRKTESQIHTWRITLDRRINKRGHTGKIDDAIQLAADFAPLHSQQRTIQVNILTPGQIRVKTWSHFYQRRQAAVDTYAPFAWRRDVVEKFKNRAFTGPVLPDEA